MYDLKWLKSDGVLFNSDQNYVGSVLKWAKYDLKRFKREQISPKKHQMSPN